MKSLKRPWERNDQMNPKDYTILIADDEREIVELLTLYLENEGYGVLHAYDGERAWKRIVEESVDLAILDIMMPKLDGFALLKKIRETYDLPLIMLSAKGEDVNKILGLGLGADDYMAKPFNPLEVTARVRAQLRRYHRLRKGTGEDQQPELIIGPYRLNTEACVLYKGGEEIPLTSTEFKIVSMLMEHPGRVFTRTQIFERIWNEPFAGDDNTIMVHVRKIREKIEEDPGKPRYLKTIRGLGYRFEKKV